MTSFLYRCPVSGLPVQGWTADESRDRFKSNQADQTEYLALRCPLCARTHLVNPATGRVLRYDRTLKST
jgi:hypothetical protein